MKSRRLRGAIVALVTAAVPIALTLGAAAPADASPGYGVADTIAVETTRSGWA